ncbi:hypothetical protein HYV80_01765 [Candidatus Woesearchaeota archaeon]|nr:hypothetical protein [Candidatus Woesearchaeota archaeon]
MEVSLKAKILGTAAVSAGLAGVIAGAIGFLAGRSDSGSSAEQLAYEAGIRLATPNSAYVILVQPAQCPDELVVQSFGEKIRLRIKDTAKQDKSGAFICEYAAEKRNY